MFIRRIVRVTSCWKMNSLHYHISWWKFDALQIIMAILECVLFRICLARPIFSFLRGIFSQLSNTFSWISQVDGWLSCILCVVGFFSLWFIAAHRTNINIEFNNMDMMRVQTEKLYAFCAFMPCISYGWNQVFFLSLLLSIDVPS